jgi:hypothetical protein
VVSNWSIQPPSQSIQTETPRWSTYQRMSSKFFFVRGVSIWMAM